ncbi:sigma-70 family RNA polymerase sigma factor [Chryseobacterium pennae]|nr:sigma-70 family RNA polymerase sigma factor [Chryseobacterium pennae]
MYKIIYNTYQQRVFSYVAGRITDRNDILDISQNVFVHLWQYRKSLGGSNTENIIFKTCNQEIFNFLAAKTKQPINVAYYDKADDSLDLLHDKIEKEELLKTVEENIELLPNPRRQIFTMHKLNGVSQEQIADQLNLSKKSVKKQIAKAMIFLKKQQNNS